jgi:23S rRNA-/tRNA-specific pseudouridylate synthase
MTEPLPCPTLLSTDEVLVVDKPPGVTVVPGRGAATGDCLWRALERAHGVRLWVVHRLDRDTSGVLVFARTAEAHRALSMAFEERRTEKRYLAAAIGTLLPARTTIASDLAPAAGGGTRLALPSEPERMKATTGVRRFAACPLEGASLQWVEVRPLTGRLHQIRVHLASAGAPLLSDERYLGPQSGLSALTESMGVWSGHQPRVALHAHALAVKPGAGLALSVMAPVPPDLAAVRDWIETHADGA